MRARLPPLSQKNPYAEKTTKMARATKIN